MSFSARNTAQLPPALRLGGFWWAALGYSFALLLLLSPLLFHKFDPMWDAFDMGFPAFTYLADAIREGRFPLWDPYTNCGFPFHADAVGTILNPIAICFGMLFNSAALGFNWFWVFYWWLGGFGMLWLSRHYEATPVGAFAAACAYALSGFFLAHAEHTGFIIVAACLPWIWWCTECAVAYSSIGYALLAGAALGFCSYGGYPGLTLFSCLALAFWLLLRFLPGSVPDAGEPRPLSTRALWIGITLAIMAVIYVAVWSPSLHAFLVEGRGYTDRVDPLPMERATGNEPFTWFAALSLLFPYLTFTWREWMGCDISMSNAYMGMLTLPLAGFWAWKTGLRRTWWLILFVVFMFIVSLGGKYGLRTLLYYAYPPTRYMQFNAPFRLFWILPVCLAAGLGLTRLLRHPEERRPLFGLLLGWGLVAGAAALAVALISARLDLPLAEDLARLFAPGTVILAAGVALLWYWAGRERFTRPASLLLALLVLADMGMHLYNNSGTVWNPQTVTRLVEAEHQRSTRIAGPPPPRIPGMPFGYLNAQQVIKVPLVGGYVTMKSAGFDEVLGKSRFVEVLSAPHRFWLSPGVEQAPTREQALAILSGTGANEPVPAFVEQPLAGLAPLRAVPGGFGSVAIRSYAPEEIELAVAVPGSAGAFLASTERYAAGWKALVDGTPQPVAKVNLYFRGVFVPPGQHVITWRYEPDGWVALVWVSYLTLSGAAIAGGVTVWMRQRRMAAEASLRSAAG